MAEAAALLPCRFTWEIRNPFVPWKRLEATFYNGKPCLTLWTVTLVPLDRALKQYFFLISIKGEKSGERHDTIVAEKIQVKITLDGGNVLIKEERNYLFSGRNRHTYQIVDRALTSPPETSHLFKIVIEITFPRENIENQESNRFLRSPKEDLKLLSKDMKHLYEKTFYRPYKDMRLTASDSNFECAVDSCILRARWTNFFKVHRGMGVTVNTNMSVEVLETLLTYLYCGRLDLEMGPGYSTELCQVIDRYKMHHLYHNLVSVDSQQVRETRNELWITRKTFTLHDTNVNPSFSWEENPDTPLKSTFQINFFFDEEVASFDYTLLSICPMEFHADYTIYAQVYLELKYESSQPRVRCFFPVHQRDFTIAANGTCGSGVCRLEGPHMSRFIRWLAGEGNNPGTSNLIRLPTISVHLTLFLSIGETSIRIYNEGPDEIPSDLKRFRVLSMHMAELQREDDAEKDLRVVCSDDETFLLHKVIFLSRVYRRLKVLDPPQRIPDVVGCSFRGDFFSRIIYYIYSAKLLPDPRVLYVSRNWNINFNELR